MNKNYFRRTLASVACVIALVLIACGDDDSSEDATTSTISTSTTTTTTPSQTSSSDTTSPADGGSALGDSPEFRPDAASGSGCTPGGDALPDGWWYGVSASTVADRSSFTFDLACFYVGPIAQEVAADRGDEVNNDVYIVNDNPTERTLPVAPGATARCVDIPAPGDDLTVGCGISDIPDPSTPWALWFRVVDGRIDRIIEQYAP